MLEALRTDKYVVIFELIHEALGCYYIDFSLNATLEIDKIVEELRAGQYANKKLQKDWAKYGYQAFRLNIVRHFSEEQIKESYPQEDMLIKMLYDSTLGHIEKRKQVGCKLYNETIPLNYESMVRKYFTYTREGKRIIKPYKQKVILDEDTQWAIMMTDYMEFPPHSHDEIELIYVIDHAVDITVNNKKYGLKPRDILFISSKDIHSFSTPGASCNRLVIIFKIPEIGNAFEFLNTKRPKEPLIVYPGEGDHGGSLHGQLEREILMIIDEYKHKQSVYALAVTARIYDILRIMARNVAFESYASGEARQFYKEIESAQKVFSYVNQHYEEAVTLQQAADAAGYSMYHFTRFFKKMTGMTFNDYLTNLRIQKSVEMLLETDKSITETAYLCGFNSVKTYNRVFKKLRQMSPRDFRKSNK